MKKLIVFCLFVLIGLDSCSKKNDSKSDLEFKDIFRADADAETDIREAIARASLEQKRVLLLFGANWCPWCQRLHHLIETDPNVRDYLARHFELVLVDLGKRDRNMEIDARYGSPNTLGIPVFVVLDRDGTRLYIQETGSLEYPKDHPKKGHDPVKVMLFLQTWATS